MIETFRYREKFAKSHCFPAIGFAALSIISAVSGYGLKVRKTTIVPYPYSLFIFILCAAGFTAYACYRYDRARKSAANPHPITLTDDSLTLPRGAGGKMVINISDITAIKENGNEEGRRLKLRANAKRYDLFEDRFDSPEEFARFEKTLKGKIKTVS